MTENFLYRGVAEPAPEMIPLRAGPLTMLFDAGDLRTIRLGEREIVRRVYVAVRDRNWGTVPARLSNLDLQVSKDAFTIKYDVLNRQDEIDFAWHARLCGGADGSIQFAMQGEARTTFEKNRIGFCLLIPADCAGQPVRIGHSTGNQEEASFPEDLCPDQPVRPFADLRSLTLPLGAAGEAVLRFSGDVFEMEDQRLWTDASFKVFCPPLSLPFPVEIQAGTRLDQQVDVLLRTQPAPGPKVEWPWASEGAGPLTFRLPPQPAWQPLPEIGLGLASHGQPLSAGEMERLGELHLHHLRVDLPLADMRMRARLEQAAGQAGTLGIGLEVALMVSAEQAEEELGRLHTWLEELRPPVVRWLVYPAREIYAGGSPTGQVLDAARRRLADFLPGTPFTAGTNADYIFLKRSPPPAQIDGVCIALNPQVHAFDDLSLLETLAGQELVVASARRLAGGRLVVVSPITLKPRFNPLVRGEEPVTLPGMLPPQVDPRQRSLFAAGWTLGSLRAMVQARAASVTYYETTGWRGVMEREGGSPWPPAYPPLPGIVFPLYHVLADWGEFTGGEAAILEGPAGSQPVSGLALRQGDRITYLLANPTQHQFRVDFDRLDRTGRIRSLDVFHAGLGMESPGAYRRESFTDLPSSGLHIAPYGYVRVDWPVGSAYSRDRI